MKNPARARALTIAGSDSGGGAGIQADLKTFSALGVFGTSALTAITAQNTVGVTAVHEVPTEVISAQIDAVLEDIGADAVKTGMLSSSPIIECVCQAIERHQVQRLVVDPVMIAKSGDSLLREDAVSTLRARLLPLAAVVTPNIPEAEALTEKSITTPEDARRAAQQIVDMGAKAVVVKGGHLEGPATDLFYDGSTFQEFTSPRIDTKNTHGTGCTFASAIAAGLARDMSTIDAVAQAKEYVTEAIRRSFPIGQGHGPLNHFYKLWE
ncbi:MAG: bifunctional hydroxymethylpyrimidine kinase/phosphomethylpyrimidine kinase [SAR202 cluster bacterium Io17-Chloro-G9]|nr:MAG: bifunctional hydroxymethylpyrimidine kinase/phosphomethylpyrimidine kinase [SAR202 cluster bacterium Io17-Chloro-G9]